MLYIAISWLQVIACSGKIATLNPARYMVDGDLSAIGASAVPRAIRATRHARDPVMIQNLNLVGTSVQEKHWSTASATWMLVQVSVLAALVYSVPFTSDPN